ncbi:MAG: Nif11-like leader peptide family natural product precursor [Xenococcaceae cyanobacterium]
MSIENAKAFYERMTTDEAFRSQYQNATTNDERRVIAEDYEFTQEEWETASAEIMKVADADGEISDAELESVAGGSATTFILNVPRTIYGGGIFPSKFRR